MARYYIERKGKWACYDTAERSFLTEFTTEEELQKWVDAEHRYLNIPLQPIKELPKRCLKGVAADIFSKMGYLNTIYRLASAKVPGEEIDRIMDEMVETRPNANMI